MSRSLLIRENGGLNPYIALSDLLIGFILIIIFMIAVGRLGLLNLRFQRSMQQFAAEVSKLPSDTRPRWERGRNDPPGAQRWVFSGRTLFRNTEPTATPMLSPEGKRALASFAGLLKKNKKRWRRIRVEGHTKPPQEINQDDWELSARRASIVVREIQTVGKIAPWFFAVAGRAGQNPLHKIVLFIKPGDESAVVTKQELIRSDVSFSAKPYSEMARDGDASALTPHLSGAFLSAILERNDTGVHRLFLTTDYDQLKKTIARFPRNERVEVVVEFTQ